MRCVGSLPGSEEFTSIRTTDPRRDAIILSQRLARFAHDPTVQQLMGETLAKADSSQSLRESILSAMKESGLAELPEAWSKPLGHQLAHADTDRLLELAVGAVHALTQEKPRHEFVEPLRKISADVDLPGDLRLIVLGVSR